MRRSARRAWAAAAVALIVVVAAAVAVLPAGAGGDGLARVRRATARFHRIEVATAAGYGELADEDGLTCIEDPGGDGAMGVHFVNGALVGDGAIDASTPEALLYDRSSPRPRLLGVEYVVFAADWGVDRDPPALFGRQFELVESPNRYGLPPFYELHAWVWVHNPDGTFEDWNPRITCGARH